MLVVLRVAALGLYQHPEKLEVSVDGDDMLPFLRDLQTLLQRRGYALGCMERHEHVITKFWGSGDEEKPLRILCHADPDADQLATTLLREFLGFD